ncbi:MAG: glycosyltransferase family 2 protein [Anaerolineae bacterium]|nr:glycosyltransferase family 2 protein [Anaerolineae bacterium]
MERPEVTVIIVNTNELHHLVTCLPTVLAQTYPKYEVLVVDNASTDGSVEYIECTFPQVTMVRNAANLGYAGANNVGFRHGRGTYLVVLNPDTRVEPDWLEELIRALENDPLAGLATSKILLMDDPQRINACGNDITYTGVTVCRGAGQHASAYDQPEIVPAVSGAGFAIKRSLLEQIGGFDEQFFIYYEETDLSLRAMLAGYHCLYVPTSVMVHKYAFRFSAEKCFREERNRLFSWLKVFRWRTFAMLLPTLVLGEVLTWGYVVLRGPEYVRSKARSYLWIVKNWRQVMEARQRTQTLRAAPDRQIVRRLSLRLPLTQIAGWRIASVMETIVQPLHWAWGQVCRVVVVW